jgi:hypothetical protein
VVDGLGVVIVDGWMDRLRFCFPCRFWVLRFKPRGAGSSDIFLNSWTPLMAWCRSAVVYRGLTHESEEEVLLTSPGG